MISLNIPAVGPDLNELPEWSEEHAVELADWLEFYALGKAENEAILENLVDAIDLKWDTEGAEIQTRDQLLETVGVVVMAEVDERRKALEQAYPFEVSRDGSTMRLYEDWTAGRSAYLMCLVLAHVTRSKILPPRLIPSEKMVSEARNLLFESCATLGAAGITQGPAFYMGQLRAGAEGLLGKLRQAWNLNRDGEVRDTPAPDAPENVNDGGIDVISWTPRPDGRAGMFYLLGQAASGHNWDSKPISDGDIDLFHRDWFDPPPASTPNKATFVPFRLLGDLHRFTFRHGRVHDRMTLPAYIDKAVDLAERGVEPIECLDNVPALRAWIERHQDAMRQVAADAT